MNQLLNILNQVFELEKKLRPQPIWNTIQRNVDRIKNEMNDLGYSLIDPLNQKFDETRTDCEASITGSGKGPLVISQVLKPIIYKQDGPTRTMVQKGVVIVESI